MDVQTRRAISGTVEDRGYGKLLLSANRKSYMQRRLAQQRMTLSDLEWPFHGLSLLSVWEERTLKELNANVTALCTSSILKSTSCARYLCSS